MCLAVGKSCIDMLDKAWEVESHRLAEAVALRASAVGLKIMDIWEEATQEGGHKSPS